MDERARAEAALERRSRACVEALPFLWGGTRRDEAAASGPEAEDGGVIPSESSTSR